MSKAMITGILTREPELSSTASGKSVCRFVAACSFRFDGKKYTDHIPVAAWDKLAEICTRHLGKGSKVRVVGRLSVREYEGRDTKRRYRTEVAASEVEILGEGSGYRFSYHVC